MSADPLLANLKATRTAMAENRLPKSALWYAQHGWNVFPCRPRAKDPLTEHGYLDATTDAEQIRAWWRQWPHANIGLALGAGYIVVDIDGGNGWAALKGAGYDLPATAFARTGRGLDHEHHLYRLPAGVHVRNGATRLPNVEVKTEGGYIIVAPSVHPLGREYKWMVPPREENIADAPEWLLALTKPAVNGNGATRTAGEWAELICGPVSEGHRRDSLLRLGGLLFRRLPAEVAFELGHLWARTSCTPPIEPAEVDRILDDVADLELRRREGKTS